MKISVYTDGGCHNHGPYKGVGAWAFVIVDHNGRLLHQESEIGEDHTTNNRMEIIAFREALAYVLINQPHVTAIEAFSDSQYVINIFNEWIYNWTTQGKIEEMANPDLLKDLAQLRSDIDSTIINFSFKWVRGHSGNKWNEYCDELCTKNMVHATQKKKIKQATDYYIAPKELTEFESMFEKIIKSIAVSKVITPEELAKAQIMLTLQKPILERTFLTL